MPQTQRDSFSIIAKFRQIFDDTHELYERPILG